MRLQLAQRHADQLISQWATAQHGVVSRAQIKAAGVTDGGLSHRLRVQRLHRVHRGVYAVGHSVLTREGRVMAAVLASGQRESSA